MIGAAAGARNRCRFSSGTFRPGAPAGFFASDAYLTGNIDSRPLAAFFILSTLVYLTIYAFESPLRFALYLVGMDSLMLLRDGLIVGPLALLFLAQALRLRLHPVFPTFAVLIIFHGLVLMGTIGSALGVAYGVKILINL